MSMNDLETKVAELRELRRMQDELAAEIAATEDSLKAAAPTIWKQFAKQTTTRRFVLSA